MDIFDEIKKGSLFIYPTDTIYGVGCNALKEECVERVKETKGRDRDKPLSVIAPSVEWIKENLVVSDSELEKYLPGPYTLILKKKKKDFLNWVSPSDTLGVRIPDCEFSLLVRKAGVPFITTSVNLSGGDFARDVKEVSKDILNKVDVVINAGILDGRPSTLVVGGKEVRR